MARQRKSIVVNGAPRSGKSELTKRLALKYYEEGGKVIVYDIGNASTWKDFQPIGFEDINRIKLEKSGLFRISIPDPDRVPEVVKKLAEGKINGMVIFDDCVKILGDGNLPRYAKSLACSFAHHEADIIFVYHCVNVCPPAIYTYCSGMYLFQTNMKPNKQLAKIPNAEKIEQKWLFLKTTQLKWVRYVQGLFDNNYEGFQTYINSLIQEAKISVPIEDIKAIIQKGNERKNLRASGAYFEPDDYFSLTNEQAFNLCPVSIRYASTFIPLN